RCTLDSSQQLLFLGNHGQFLPISDYFGLLLYEFFLFSLIINSFIFIYNVSVVVNYMISHFRIHVNTFFQKIILILYKYLFTTLFDIVNINFNLLCLNIAYYLKISLIFSLYLNILYVY